MKQGKLNDLPMPGKGTVAESELLHISGPNSHFLIKRKQKEKEKKATPQ